MRCYILLALIVLCLVAKSNAARILAVLPIFAKSHHYCMQPILEELLNKGHHVTFYTPIPLKSNSTNLKQIDIHTDFEKKLMGEMNFKTVRSLGQIPYLGPIGFWFFSGITADILGQEEMQKLIHSDEKYDLVILEPHFAQEAFVAFGHKFQAPVVSLATFSTFVYIDEFFGNPMALSYVPSFELPYNSDMTFLQRVHNTLRAIVTSFLGYVFYIPYHDSVIRTYFNYTGSETIPPLADMLRNIALVIINSQIAVDYSRPFVPNVIQAAGLHLEEKPKPLPKDLQQFMDNSKNGVIYFSFGSVVPSEDMPEDMKQGFIRAFAKLKQNVLWKLPVDDVPDLPKNVKIEKWLPQQSILAHPNCVAFITHGGLLSQLEAVYHAVPLIGIPFFGDQYMNIERASYDGFAISLDQYSITEEKVSWAINELLHNPKYRENMKTRSKILRDNPERPIDKAVWWVEYVIRHKGAPHLRSQGRNLPWHKYLLLDVAVFIVLVVIAIISLLYLAFKFVFSYLCSSKKTPAVKTSKKKN